MLHMIQDQPINLSIAELLKEKHIDIALMNSVKKSNNLYFLKKLSSLLTKMKP